MLSHNARSQYRQFPRFVAACHPLYNAQNSASLHLCQIKYQSLGEIEKENLTALPGKDGHRRLLA